MDTPTPLTAVTSADDPRLPAGVTMYVLPDDPYLARLAEHTHTVRFSALEGVTDSDAFHAAVQRGCEEAGQRISAAYANLMQSASPSPAVESATPADGG